MPLHHAVLALLAGKPAHGYELKASFEEAVGEQWGGLNIGHLYQILDRLRREGLVETERQPQPVKPDRLVHHLTPAGREELDRWLAEPSARNRGYRDDFFLKMMAAVRTGDRAAVTGVLARQRAHLLRELSALTKARALGSAAVVDLLITAAELHVRADLQFTDAAEAALGTGELAVGPPEAAGASDEASTPARPGKPARAAGLSGGGINAGGEVLPLSASRGLGPRRAGNDGRFPRPAVRPDGSAAAAAGTTPGQHSHSL